MMASIHTALRPGGQVVLIDFQRIPGKSSDWILNHVRAGQEVVTQEVTSCGFKQVQQKPFLKENYLVRFEKVGHAEGQNSTFRYKKTKQGDLELHVHFPPDWKKGDQRAAIVFFFGGGWVGGTVNQFKPQAAYLAQRGLVAARADYRVKSRQGVSPATCVEDAKSAIRWIRQNAVQLGVDPHRIVAAGGSAGGHIAACSGCCPGLDGEGEKAPPALLLYGKQDRLLRQGEEYLARAKEVGSRAELFLAPGVGHGFFNGPPWQERTLQRVDEFLGTLGYVKGGTIRVP
jgi:acetyl esterase/lipase